MHGQRASRFVGCKAEPKVASIIRNHSVAAVVSRTGVSVMLTSTFQVLFTNTDFVFGMSGVLLFLHDRDTLSYNLVSGTLCPIRCSPQNVQHCYTHYTYTRACTRTRTQERTHRHKHTHIHTCVRVHAHIYTNTHKHTHTQHTRTKTTNENRTNGEYTDGMNCLALLKYRVTNLSSSSPVLPSTEALEIINDSTASLWSSVLAWVWWKWVVGSVRGVSSSGAKQHPTFP